jgi:drug/metabolite transporter (DMT)-like permease
LLGSLLLGEMLTMNVGLALALIAAGLIVVNRPVRMPS